MNFGRFVVHPLMESDFLYHVNGHDVRAAPAARYGYWLAVCATVPDP